MIKKYLNFLIEIYSKEPSILSPNEIQRINKKIYKIGENKPYSGKIISKHKNDQIHYEENYKNGKPFGIRKTFSLTGELKIMEKYVHGKYIKIK